MASAPSASSCRSASFSATLASRSSLCNAVAGRAAAPLIGCAVDLLLRHPPAAPFGLRRPSPSPVESGFPGIFLMGSWIATGPRHKWARMPVFYSASGSISFLCEFFAAPTKYFSVTCEEEKVHQRYLLLSPIYKIIP